MSTPTATTNYGGFQAVGVNAMPKLYCVGTVAEIGESKVTKDGQGDYVNCRFTLKGEKGSPKVIGNFLYRPEWFTPGYNALGLKDVVSPHDVAGKKTLGQRLLDMYQKVIYASPKPMEDRLNLTVLEGLCGSTENFNAFVHLRNEYYASKVVADPARGEGHDFTAEEIRELLVDFLIKTHGDNLIGYILTQKKEKVGDEYMLAEGYELNTFNGCFWIPTEDRIKGLTKSIEKSGGKSRFGFEVD